MQTYPLLQSQMGVFLDTIKYTDVMQYNLPSYACLGKDMDAERLASTIYTIFEKRRELHLSFMIDEEGNPRQYFNPDIRFKVERKQMTEQECLDYIHNGFVRPFDIFGNESLFRSELIETENGLYMLFDMYHLVADGMSYTPILTTQDFPKAFAGEDLGDMSYGMVEAALDEQASFGTEQYAKAKQTYAEKFAGMDFVRLSEKVSNPVGKMIRERAFVPTADVDAWCKENGVAVNLLFQAAFSYVVSMVVRENKIAYHTESHGRLDKRLRNAYGMYVRSVPVLSVIEPGMTVRDYIMSFRRELMATVRNMAYPFNHLCADLDMTPGMSFNFQAIAGWDETLHVGDKTFAGVQPDRGDVFSDLMTFIFLYKDQYEIRLESSEALNSRATMRTLADAIRNVVLNMMDSLDGPLADIRLVGEEETQRLIELGAGPRIDLDPKETFIHVFVRQAAQTPDALAVADEHNEYTYRQIDQWSNALAHILVGEGVKPDEFVCVMLDRDYRFPLSVFAIHKAAAAYTPLDIEYPNERLSYMIENSESPVLLTTHDVLKSKMAEGGLELGNIRVIFIDDLDLATGDCSPINLTTPQNLAYMIYTSGSTGLPKGVMLQQGGLRSYVASMVNIQEITAADRISHHRAFSFDAHIMDLYPALAVGGSIHIMPTSIRKDMTAMRDFIVSHKITGGAYTTSLGALLLNTYKLPVRYMGLSGEVMVGLVSGDVQLINAYGPTECTDLISTYRLEKGRVYDVIPIGRPMANGFCFIVDQNNNLLPKGVAGELCFASTQVARGYWKLPEQTEQVFVDCPYVPGLRMYHTRDLCRWNAEGQIECLGRIDSQVKLRGFRIELGEIETKALGIEGVQQVAAQVRKVNNIDQLVLYYTLAEGCELTKGDIRKALEATSLTEYMIPGLYMELDEMPRTPSGKIDRRMLPEPEFTSTIEYAAPANDTERAIASAIKEVLDVHEEVGTMNNFFEYGGDSIKSIKLCAMLRKQGITLTVADVMKGKTVRGIAGLAHTGETVSISQETVEGEIATGAVMRYFFGLNLPHAEHYNQSVAFESKTRLNADALKTSLAAIAVHHDMLRMRAEGSRVYINKVSDHLYDFLEEDATSLTEVEAKSDAQQRTIDLATGPVLKVALFHMPVKDVVVMICHHLAVDGVSWRIIAEDLNTGYQMAAEGKEITLPKKTHSYKHYAEAIRRYRDSYALSTQKVYWQGVQAKMASMQENDIDNQRGLRKKAYGSFTDDAVRHLLTDAHHAYGTDENDLLVAALVRSYRKLTGKSSASVLMEGHGREPIHEPLVIDSTVGWFTSMYPLVIENLNGDIRHDVRTVKEAFRNIPCKGLGYGILQYIPSAEGDDCLRTDLVETLGLNYLGELTEGNTDAMLSLNMQIPTGSRVNPEGVTGPGFMLDCSIAGNTLSIEATYDSNAWTEAQANEMIKVFYEELQAIVTHTLGVTAPETTASDLGATGWTDEQYQTVTAEFSARGENIDRIYPLSPMQEGMLLEYMMNPGTTVYVLLSRFAMDMLPTDEQMQTVLDGLAARHEVFRTSIIYKGVDNPCQAITDRKPALKFVDISGEADIMAASKRVHEEELHAGFNLQSDPLLRAVVMKTGEKSCHLLLCTHHIIVDGWCLPIYLSDFFTLLTEAMGGNVNALPIIEDKGRYEEAVRSMLGMDKKASMRYWKDLIGDYSEKAIIPYDSESLTNNPGEVQTVTITTAFQDKLKAVGGTYGVTFNTLIELAWGLVLHTYNRNRDAVFGKVVSGRNHGDVADLVGLFINTVPVRIRTDKDTTVSEALQSLQQQASDTTRYDYCALSEIQQLSELGKDLFQSSLTFENYEGSDGLWEMAKKVGVTVLQSDEVNFSELNVTVRMGADGQLEVSFTYDGRLYSYDTIDHVKALFMHLLEEMAVHADSKISELSLLDEQAKAELIKMSEGKHLDVDITKTFIQLFTEQAQRTPDALAVADADSQFTYSELDGKSNALAHILVESGVRPNDFVCVMMERKKEFILAVHAIHKAGAAYSPLDIEYPIDRLQYMIENSEAKVIITSHEVLDEKRKEPSFSLDENSIRIIYMDEITLDGTNAEPICLTKPQNLAYMIYTSGSTGKPKGTMLHQEGLMNFIEMVKDMEQLTADDRIECYRSFSFDAHVEDIYAVLTLGGSVHIMPSEIRKDIALVRQFILDHKITGGGYATAIGGIFIQTYPDLPVRFITLGGEKLENVYSDTVRIINVYGPTECTCDTHYYVIEPGTSVRNIPIGKSVPNHWSFIVSPDGALLPQGAIGELCFAGVQVGRGYWRLPEKTAEVFVDCPFVEKDCYGRKVRMYHTGDLARWNKDGNLEYLGRIDHQVKLRGFRIEFGEIESQTLLYPAISQAAVQVKKINGTDHLCLYYTSEQQIDADSLKAHLAAVLAEYMVPTAYVQMDAMPLTPNGKINRKALPDPHLELEDIVAPETETEKQLWNIVSEALKTKELGVTTNLAHYGMTSLVAMRLAMTIQKDYDVQVPVAELIKEPMIRAIAAKIDEKMAKEAAAMSMFTKRNTEATPGEKKFDPFATKKADPFAANKKKNPFA